MAGGLMDNDDLMEMMRWQMIGNSISGFGNSLQQIDANRRGYPYRPANTGNPAQNIQAMLALKEQAAKEAERKQKIAAQAQLFGMAGSPWTNPDTGQIGAGGGLMDKLPLTDPQKQIVRAAGLMDPEKAVGLMGQFATPKPPTIQEFYEEGSGLPYKAQLDPNTNAWSRVGGTKTDMLSPGAVQQKMNIAAAGRPNTEVKVEQKTGESLAKPIGEMVESTRSGALGALDTLDSVTRIREAMTTANLGPTATLRQNADRVASVLGIAGNSTEERLAATRSVVKGLSELTLASRKSLKGQGQVSDFEGRLLEKAASGEIDSLTGAELKVILDVSDRLARKQHALHGQMLDRLKANPNYNELAPFYDVPGLPEAKGGATGGWSIQRVK